LFTLSREGAVRDAIGTSTRTLNRRLPMFGLFSWWPCAMDTANGKLQTITPSAKLSLS
jgi:hypothetical protein